MATRKPPSFSIPMPHMHPVLRRRTFAEVNSGYVAWQAVAEANRCQWCADRPCASACPLEMDVPAFIEQVADGEFEAAYDLLVAHNPLPAICSRICPQEAYCEGLCGRASGFEPVGIGKIERFIADWAEARGRRHLPIATETTGHAVAVVGAGPAGLTAAADLARLGHQVTVFEASPEPGGTVAHQIPEFRLPRAVVRRELDQLTRMGIEIRTQHVIGDTLSVEELFTDLAYEAVFLAAGAPASMLPDIPGIGLAGVYTSAGYFATLHLDQAEPRVAAARGNQVVVVGGSDHALDAARAAVRLGAAKVSVVQRGSREQMSARPEEVEYALEEGIHLLLLAEPIEVVGDRKKRVQAVRFQELALSEPVVGDPVPIPDATFVVDANVVVFAGDADGSEAVRDSEWGPLSTDVGTGATQRKGVFAGGHLVTGSASVISAMAAGRRAALAIHRYLQTPLPDGC
jgi:glutamate synthase (NADPH/NADH) small chain